MSGQAPMPPGWYDDGQGNQRWFDGAAWSEHVMSAGPAPTPPGWYDDGSGRTRWFDGSQWGQYAPTAPPPGIPAPAAPTAAWNSTPGAQPPVKKKRTGLKVGIGVAVAIIALIVVISSLSSGAKPAGGSASPSGTTTHSPTGSTSGLNSPVRDGKFQFDVSSIKCGAKQEGLETAQGMFCVVSLKVENIGSEAQTFDDSAQKLHDAAGRSYDVNSVADVEAASQAWLADINPGNSVTGEIIFDVPASFVPHSIELHDSIFSGGVTVNFPS